MSTKTCPSCGADVPQAATRCKECFHDFSAEGQKSFNWIGPLFVLGIVAVMTLLLGGVLAFVFVQPLEEHVLVDDETDSIIWTTKYRTGVTTDRLPFDQVASIEHAGHGATFTVTAVTTTGDRKVVTESTQPLDAEARGWAKLMGKPLVEPDPRETLLKN